MRQIFILISLFLSVVGCHFLERGFGFSGEYLAARSGYRIVVQSGGIVKPEHDISDSAFSVVRICPLRNLPAKSLLFSLMAKPDEWIRLDCEHHAISGAEWNWKTEEKLLSDLLLKSGYVNLDVRELKDSIRAIEGSLAGPKGGVMKGQAQSIEVIRSEHTYNMKVFKNRRQSEWVRPTEVPSC